MAWVVATTNMSDGAFDPEGWAPIDLAPAPSGFRTDARFAPLGEAPPAFDTSMPEGHAEDPVAVAFAEGYAAGAAEAQARADEQAAADAAAREGLALSIMRLDAELAEQLRQRLRDTVAALCEAAIAPLALDENALLARIERALALFVRADDERMLRLHPDDIALLSTRFAADWQVVPDRTLGRGSLRVETASGGVEDGPEMWRRAISEALHQC